MPIDRPRKDSRRLRLAFSALLAAPGVATLFAPLFAVPILGIAFAYYFLLRSYRWSLIVGMAFIGARIWFAGYLAVSRDSTAALMFFMVMIIDVVAILLGAVGDRLVGDRPTRWKMKPNDDVAARWYRW